MSLVDDMNAKRPGEWTQDDIKALQRKHGRIHFTHFQGVELKPRRYKTIRGKLHAWHLGAWREVKETK